MAEIISFAEKKQAKREKLREQWLHQARSKANDRLQKAFQNLMNEIISGNILVNESGGILQKPNGIEFRETEKALFLKFHLKNFKRENLRVRVTDQMICVDLIGAGQTSENPDSVTQDNATNQVQSISHCVPLPFSVVKDSVRAKFKEGALYLELPRATEAASSERIVPVE